MINVGIIEDEIKAATHLKELIELFGKEKEISFAVTVFGSAEQYEARAGKFDVLFIDIELPGANGMDTARRIRTGDENVIIVFVTNISRMAIEGYGVGAIDYILKPATKAALFSAMSSVMRALDRKRDVRIIVNTPTGETYLSASEIVYVEVFGHSLVYHTGSGDVTEWAALSKPEKVLSGYGFVRCNKSYLVNLRYVTGVSGDEVTVAGVRLKIGKMKSKGFLDVLNKYMNG